MSQVLNAERSAIVAPDLSSPGFKANPYPFYARLRGLRALPVTVG